MLAISFKESDSYYSVINPHHPHAIKDTFPPSLSRGLGGKTRRRVFQRLPSRVLFLSEWRPYGHIKLKLGGSEL